MSVWREQAIVRLLSQSHLLGGDQDRVMGRQRIEKIYC